MEESHTKFLQFQIRRNIINLSKDFLINMEDWRDNNLISEDSYNKIRTKILNKSNDTIRELTALLDEFTVELNKT